MQYGRCARPLSSPHNTFASFALNLNLELGALEDIRGDISVPLTRMLGHWWAISGPEMLLSVTLVHCKPEVYDASGR